MERMLANVVVAVGLVACAGCCSTMNTVGERGDSGQPGPRTDECGNGVDDDGNGRIDDGCPCGAGETQACFTGSAASRQVGACTDGVQTCQGVEWGDWGDSPCVGGTAPSAEECDGLDHDCDGARDEDCPCTAGMTQECGLEFLTAPCRGGTQTCRADGTWSGCDGAVGPMPDVCDGVDNDCDGTPDEGCGCVPVVEICRDGIDNDCDREIDEPACTPDWPPGCVPLVPATGSDWSVEATSLIPASGVRFHYAHVAVDASENIYLAGTVCGGSATIAGIAVPSVVPAATLGCQLFLVALRDDRTVRYSWQPTTRELAVPPPSSTGPYVTVDALVPDGSGGVWVGGAFKGRFSPTPGVEHEETTAFSAYDMYVVHLDSTGGVVHEFAFGERGSDEELFDLVLTAAGVPVVFGRSYSPVLIIGTSIIRPLPDGYGQFLFAIDESSGGARWVTRLGGDDIGSWANLFGRGTAWVYPRLVFDPISGAVVMPGYSRGNARLGDMPVVGTPMWLWSISPTDGSTVSLRTFTPTVGGSIARAFVNAAGVGFSGDVGGAVDLGAGPLASTSGFYDWFVATTDAAGMTTMSRTVVSPMPRDAFHATYFQTLWTSCLDAVLVGRGVNTLAPTTSTNFDDGVVSLEQSQLHIVEYDRTGALRSRRSVTTGLARDQWAVLSRQQRVVYVTDTGRSLNALRLQRLGF